MGQCCSLIRTSNFKNDAEVFEDIAKEHMKIRQFDQSLYYFQKAIDFHKGKGPEHQEALASIYLKVVRLYEMQDNFDQEMTYYKLALDVYTNLYGETDRRVEEVCEAIATGYWMEGIHDEAARYYERLIAIKKKVSGENSMDMAGLHEKLAISFEKMELFEKAIEHYRMAIAIKRDVGAENEAFSLLWNKMGRIYLDYLKQYDKAKECYDSLLSVDKEMRGELHYCTSLSYLGLGRAKALLKQLESAYQDLERSLEIAQRVEWPDQAQRSRLFHIGYVFLTIVTDVLGKRTESLENERKWLELQLGEDSGTGYAFVFHSRLLGEVLNELGEYYEAETHYKLALEALKMLGSDVLERARINISYAATLAELKEFQSAISLLNVTKKELEKDYSQFDEMIELEYQMAYVKIKQEDYEFGIQSMIKVLNKYKDKYGSQHITVINTLYKIGIAYKLEGNSEEALTYLKEAYKARTKPNIKILRKQANMNALEYESNGVIFDLSKHDHLQNSGKAFTKELYRFAVRSLITGKPKMSPTETEIWDEMREICNKDGRNFDEIRESLKSG